MPPSSLLGLNDGANAAFKMGIHDASNDTIIRLTNNDGKGCLMPHNNRRFRRIDLVTLYFLDVIVNVELRTRDLSRRRRTNLGGEASVQTAILAALCQVV